jgi:hypothetical protein
MAIRPRSARFQVYVLRAFVSSESSLRRSCEMQRVGVHTVGQEVTILSLRVWGQVKQVMDEAPGVVCEMMRDAVGGGAYRGGEVCSAMSSV